MPEDQKFFRYFSILHLTLIVLLLSCFLLNTFIDPLWYWKGNQLTHINLPSNERLSKINLFLQEPNNYNCFIFGSSRTTLLNQNEIENFNCFNFSFSSGRIDEFLAYAEYLKFKGYSPDLVILGVDEFNFFDKNENNIPDFILSKKKPQNRFETALSIGTLQLSIKALLELKYLPRYYNESFTVSLFEPLPFYKPELTKTGKTHKNKIYNLDNYLKFRHIFENATYIAYAPPISAWRVYDLFRQDKIESYLKAMYHISTIYRPFYDFTIPSKVTTNKNVTYDGSHYILSINKLITTTINKKINSFGLQVDKLTRAEYKQHYFNAIKKFEKKFIAHKKYI